MIYHTTLRIRKLISTKGFPSDMFTFNVSIKQHDMN